MGSRGGMAFSAQSRRGFGVRRQRVWLSAPRVQAIFGSTLAAAAALLSAWTLCGIFAAPRSSPPQAFTLALATEEPAPRSDPAAARFAARFDSAPDRLRPSFLISPRASKGRSCKPPRLRSAWRRPRRKTAGSHASLIRLRRARPFRGSAEFRTGDGRPAVARRRQSAGPRADAVGEAVRPVEVRDL